MFVLVLNCMRAPQHDMRTNICHAETEEELLGFLAAEGQRVSEGWSLGVVQPTQ